MTVEQLAEIAAARFPRRRLRGMVAEIEDGECQMVTIAPIVRLIRALPAEAESEDALQRALLVALEASPTDEQLALRDSAEFLREWIRRAPETASL